MRGGRQVVGGYPVFPQLGRGRRIVRFVGHERTLLIRRQARLH
jgi:hypothetical protein